MGLQLEHALLTRRAPRACLDLKTVGRDKLSPTVFAFQDENARVLHSCSRLPPIGRKLMTAHIFGANTAHLTAITGIAEFHCVCLPMQIMLGAPPIQAEGT